MRKAVSGTCALLAVWVAVLLGFALCGCEIEETKPPEAGTIVVSLADTNGSPIHGARIRLDGLETPRYTPASLSEVSAGNHTVSAFKPGFVDTSVNVVVQNNQTVFAQLVTQPIEGGNIELQGAPDGTILILNNVAVGSVPVTPDFPALFARVGLGSYRASAFLSGHATELPAQWLIQLAANVTVPISPLFIPETEGVEIGQLAPVFDLPCDWDSSHYRLQDYRGQVVLVSFFFFNCSACIEEFPYIARIYREPEYAGKVQFFGIDFIDSYRTFSRFREDHPTLGISFPLLHDSQNLHSEYNVSVCPANFLIDATGRVRLATGGISEPQLRQSLDALLNQANSHTFSFEMHDTLISYSDGNQSFLFHGRVENLLNAQRSFVFDMNPVVKPDTNRLFSICTWGGCFAPRSDRIIVHQQYPPLKVDTLVSFDIYNQINDWSGEFPLPVDFPLSGDYEMHVAVYPADNTAERIEYRLRLDDQRIFSRTPPFTSKNAFIERQTTSRQ